MQTNSESASKLWLKMSESETVRNAIFLIFVFSVSVGAVQNEDICSKDIRPNDNCSKETQTDVPVNGCSPDSRSFEEENLSKNFDEVKCPLVQPTSTTSADGRYVDLKAFVT